MLLCFYCRHQRKIALSMKTTSQRVPFTTAICSLASRRFWEKVLNFNKLSRKLSSLIYREIAVISAWIWSGFYWKIFTLFSQPMTITKLFCNCHQLYVFIDASLVRRRHSVVADLINDHKAQRKNIIKRFQWMKSSKRILRVQWESLYLLFICN